jgi:hypothetical protein
MISALPTLAAEPATQPETAARDFAKGARTFSLHTNYQYERTGDDQYLAQVSAGWGNYLADNFAVEPQAVGYFGHDEEDSVGIGFNLVTRYHFINVGRFSLYGDILGGMFIMSNDFPTTGTCFNFTYGGGPGISYRLAEKLYLDAGARFQHVSNAMINGRDHNPVFNSYGGYIGLTWMLD